MATVYADVEKELHEATLFPRKALRPMSLVGLDNLFVYVLIIAFSIGKSRKFTVPSGFSAVFRQRQGIPAISGRSVCRAGLCQSWCFVRNCNGGDVANSLLSKLAPKETEKWVSVERLEKPLFFLRH